MKLADITQIHFVGIGGIGMSGLAQIFHAKGKSISGSDQNTSAIIERLAKKEIEINIGHSSENIKPNTNLLVHSHAVSKDNPEIQRAEELKIRTITYPEALALLCQEFFTIAITGTHGKSTTTAMTALTLIEAGLDPTVIVGTKLKEFDEQNFRVGKSKYLVIEACEYKSSFHNLCPDILAITNIEADHLDYFKTAENYRQSFKTLLNKLPKKTKIILNPNDQLTQEICSESESEIIKWDSIIDFPLNVPGEFNKENATFAQAIAKELGAEDKDIKKALQSFTGTWRRMEFKEVENLPVQFIDDYAHHPTEVKLTLKAIRGENPKAKILCVFQPHQYSRTRELLKDFGTSFSAADRVIIPNIYQVRDTEEDIKSVSVDDLVAEITNNSVQASNGGGLTLTAEVIKKEASNYDIIVTMGAGNITSIYELL